MIRYRILLAHVVVATTLVLPARAAPPIDIGSRVEMFVDRFLIGRLSGGADLRLTEPQRREIVLTLDQPWEGPVSAYYSVFRDGEVVRLYYRGGEAFTCYAESRDGGVHFTRPDLGLIDFKGSTHNNIIYRGKESASFAPFRDTNPNCKPEQRYKALAYLVIKGNKTGLVAFVSPDGVRWSKLQDQPVMIGSGFDSLNVVSWDAIEKKYICFSRYWDAGEFAGHRAIQSCTSDDFLHWSAMRPNQYAPDVPTEDFYTSAIIRCPGGAEHTWLAFPKRFVPDRKKIPTHPEPGLSDAIFMSSRDGEHWDRTFLEAWLRPGPDQQNWTERSTMPAWGIVISDDEPDVFNMYVSEHYRWPTNRLRRVTVGRHRFASVHAGAKEGEVVTKSFTFGGGTLRLNYSTSAAGSVRAELEDGSGQPIPGFALSDSETIFGDEFDHLVKWKGGNLSALARRPVRIRLVLRDADVFAVHFNP